MELCFEQQRSVKLKIARILYPVHVLGPGKRVAIWTYGCNHHCEGCANPELWDSEGLTETSSDMLRTYLDNLKERGAIDGITITGGDPFLYPKSLMELINIALEYTEDILVYTGFLKQELEYDEVCSRILENVAVLIDGKYIQHQNNGHVLKGSDNQQIYYLKEQYRGIYEQYIIDNQGKYLAENFPARNGVISVGIHKPDFKDSLKKYKSIGGANE